MHRSGSVGRGVVFFAGLLLVVAGAAPASAESGSIGRIDKVSGKVTLVHEGTAHPARVGEALYEQDVIETGADGQVGLVFNDRTVSTLSPGSHLSLEMYRFEAGAPQSSGMLARLSKGKMAMLTGELTKQMPGSIRIKTPRVIMGVRGTMFVVDVDEP